jgi:predicted P-loop ATPase
MKEVAPNDEESSDNRRTTAHNIPTTAAAVAVNWFAQGDQDEARKRLSRKLSEDHIVELCDESKIAPTLVDVMGFRTLRSAKEAAKLVGRPEKAFAEHMPAMVIPYRKLGREQPVLNNVKPRTPLPGRKGQKPQKYVRPKGVMATFNPPLYANEEELRRDVRVPLVVVEGEKKAASIISAMGPTVMVVGISGVDTWGRGGKLHPDFDGYALRGRTVYVVWDGDRGINAHVAAAERRLAMALQRAGAVPLSVDMPATMGADDLLASVDGDPGPFIERLRAAAEFHFTDEEELTARVKAQGGRDRPVGWTLDLTYRETGKGVQLDRSEANAEAILLCHDAWRGVLAYNERIEAPVLLRPMPQVGTAEDRRTYPCRLQDHDAIAAQRWLGAHYDVTLRREMVLTAMAAAAQHHRFDPVRQYLEGLAWDGESRVDSWLFQYLGVEPNDVRQAYGRCWLISAVARALDPGCKVDHVLILEGPQGIRKSTALRTLAGPSEWFSESLEDFTGKDAHEHVRGPWILELSELGAIKRNRDVQRVKQFISSQSDRYRPPYHRHSADFPRRCVFAGSTNDETYLSDPTGARRFWSVRCHPVTRDGKLDVAGLAGVRDQLWAEAVALYRAGAPHWLDDARLEAEAAEEQAERLDRDPWEPTVLEVLNDARLASRDPFVTADDIFDALEINNTLDRDKRRQMRISGIVKAAGWTKQRRRVGDVRVWGHVPGPTGLTSREGGPEVGPPNPQENQGETQPAQPAQPSPSVGLGKMGRTEDVISPGGLRKVPEGWARLGRASQPPEIVGGSLAQPRAVEVGPLTREDLVDLAEAVRPAADASDEEWSTYLDAFNRELAAEPGITIGKAAIRARGLSDTSTLARARPATPSGGG